jgi:hypothetical protein
MPEIYRMKHEKDVEEVLEAMREHMAKTMGVTVNGNRCTVRWYLRGKLVDVHMVIVNVTTPGELDKEEEIPQ